MRGGGYGGGRGGYQQNGRGGMRNFVPNRGGFMNRGGGVQHQGQSNRPFYKHAPKYLSIYIYSLLYSIFDK